MKRFLQAVFDRLRHYARVFLQRGRVVVDEDWDELEPETRRLRVEIEEGLHRNVDWDAFEPDDEQTWARLRGQAEGVLNGFWQAGRLVGVKPEQAFYARCDRTTITQDDLDAGRLILIVGFAPLRPAEFVTIRIPRCFNCP